MGKSMYKKSLELNPNYIQGHLWYGLTPAWIEKNYAEAIRHATIAMTLDPLSPIAHALSATLHISSGQFERGLVILEKVMELDPSNFLGPWQMGVAQLNLGDYSSSIESFQLAQEISKRHRWHGRPGLRIKCTDQMRQYPCLWNSKSDPNPNTLAQP